MNREKPNVLFICTDQQRFDTLGCYSNPCIDTPNLDRLAERGVLFERAYPLTHPKSFWINISIERKLLLNGKIMKIWRRKNGYEREVYA